MSRSELTARQREIVRLIALSHRSKRIGQLLGISHKTVETHRMTIMRITGQHDVAALTRYAIREGIISLDDPLFETNLSNAREQRSLQRLFNIDDSEKKDES
jgi:DNA-binding CsgD family transcriptional regulator